MSVAAPSLSSGGHRITAQLLAIAQIASAEKKETPRAFIWFSLSNAAALCSQKRVILCAASAEHNAREIANTRRARRAERFVAAFLSATKMC